MFDIVFISYNEPNAEENWTALKQRFPTAQRVHGVEGIHQAHIAAAKKTWTKMFWVVDGDAEILEEFDFSYFPNDTVQHWSGIKAHDTVHVWRSKNPVNDLEYGYGGVKLLPRQATIDMDVKNTDMTTSISPNFKAMSEVSNVTAFNTDEFSAWRGGFRECCKLSSKVIDRQKNDETDKRLHDWCTKGDDKPFGKYAMQGAQAGSDYGKKHQNNDESLKMINDFNWLQEKFNEQYS